MITQTFPNRSTSVLEDMIAINGAHAAAVVDLKSGVCVAEKEAAPAGGLGPAATMSAGTLRTMTRFGRMMADAGEVEDMVATFHGQYYVIRPLQGHSMEGLFLLLVLERGLSSDALAFARCQLQQIIDTLPRLPRNGWETLFRFPNASCREKTPIAAQA